MGLVGPDAHWARPGHSVAGVFASFALSLLAWPLLAGGAQGPGLDAPITIQKHTVAAPFATLTRKGHEVVLTGSVAMLFNTGSFPGPNRAEKVTRARLTPDGVTVSSGFDAIRVQLAALK